MFNSPFSVMLVDETISLIKHLIILFVSKNNVGFEQILVERIHSGSETAQQTAPFASLNIYCITCSDY